MADNVGYTPGVGAIVAADDIAGVLHQRVKIGIGGDGVAVDVSAANPMPITAPTPLAVTGGLTDAELRSTPVPVDGPLTDAELRASAVPVSGPLTDAQLRASAVAVTGGLTDAQLRATPIDVELVASSLSSPLQVIDTVADESAQSMILLLTRMLNYLNAPMGYDKSLQRQRGTVTVESGTVTTVGTVTTLSNIDGYNGRMQILDQNRVAWAQCVRACIT
jgi:hypothetical protein